MAALLCSCVVLASSSVYGQTTPEALPEIALQSTGREDPKAPVKGYVAKTSSSATKTDTPILETPQSISVITRDQIDAQNAQTVGEALNYIPGVVGAPFGSDPRFDSPRIRGFDGRQSQFLNGLRMMRTAGAPAVELYGLERVEVLRGPSSVMFGQGNPGGLINLISKRPTFEAFGQVGVQVGSYDYKQATFDIGGPLGEGSHFAYRLTGLARKAGAQTDSLDNDRYFIAPAVTWQPTDDTKLTILTSVQHDNPSTPSGLPQALVLRPAGARLSRDFFIGDKGYDKSDRTLTNLGYEFEHRFAENWVIRQNARYSHFDWDYQAIGMATAGLALDGHTINRSATDQDELLKTFNVDTNLLGKFSTGSVDHTLVLGIDYRYFDNDVRTQFLRATPVDAFDPDRDAPIAVGPRTLDTSVKTRIKQTGIYAQDELALGQWRATLGLRHDDATTSGDTTNNLTGVPRSLDQDDKKTTGRAGLSYLFENGFAPYLSYATSFEPVPPTATLPQTNPTTGKQVEAGVKYQPVGWNAFFAVAVYDLRQRNVVTTDNSGAVAVTAQIGEVHVRGVELEGVASLMEGLDLRAAYTYMDGEIVEGVNDGNRPDNVPKHSAGLWLKYTFQEGSAVSGLGIGGGVRYVGQRFGDAPNIYDLPGETLFDATVSYQSDHYTASINVQNIADKRYVASCGSFGCYYGDGRTVTGRLTYNW
jgi:iron complex outermembrane receptor protein